MDHRRRLDYLLQRELREGRISAFYKIFNKHKVYSIWGAGRDGKKIMTILHHLPLEIDRIYDIHAKENDSLYGVPIIIPNERIIRECKSIIIIATRRYEKEISTYLESLTLKKNVDFYLYDDICNSMYNILKLRTA